jgi:hypothetical protein
MQNSPSALAQSASHANMNAGSGEIKRLLSKSPSPDWTNTKEDMECLKVMASKHQIPSTKQQIITNYQNSKFQKEIF